MRTKNYIQKMDLEAEDLVDLVGEYFQQPEFCIWTRQLNLHNNQKKQYQSNKHQKPNYPT